MPNKRKARDCAICGANFRPSHPAVLTCSRACGVALRRSTARTMVCGRCGGDFEISTASRGSWTCPPCRAPAPAPACSVCANPVLPPRFAHCSSACAIEAKLRSDKLRLPQRQLVLVGQCHGCKGLTLGGDRRRCDGCVASSKANRKRRERIQRRHLDKVIEHERYTMAEVAGWTDARCALCDLMVDMAAKVPDPGAPTIDHRVPLARGGHDVRANVQLAHFICNAKKRDRVA